MKLLKMNNINLQTSITTDTQLTFVNNRLSQESDNIENIQKQMVDDFVQNLKQQ